MRNIRLAELLLSVVMPTERADATVGDLLESARAPIGFWWACSRTLSGTALRQISLISAVSAIGIAVPLNIILTTALTALLTNSNLPGPSFDIGFFLLAPIFTGYLMARMLPGRETGGWIAVMLFMSAVWIGWWSSIGILHLVITLMLIPPEALALMLIGGLLARIQTVRQQKAVA